MLSQTQVVASMQAVAAVRRFLQAARWSSVTNRSTKASKATGSQLTLCRRCIREPAPLAMCSEVAATPAQSRASTSPMMPELWAASQVMADVARRVEAARMSLEMSAEHKKPWSKTSCLRCCASVDLRKRWPLTAHLRYSLR
jgi:hypothetical protein